MAQERLSIEKVLLNTGDLFENWDSRYVKGLIQEEYYNWLVNLKDWKNFVTLTFDKEVSTDVANSYYKRLVQLINKRLLGERYTRKVGHSYFNYVQGIEYTLNREVCHFHVLIDKPIDYELIHNWWSMCCGWSWIEQIRDKQKCLTYVTKYVCKQGTENLNLYLKAKNFTSCDLPAWWCGQ